MAGWSHPGFPGPTTGVKRALLIQQERRTVPHGTRAGERELAHTIETADQAAPVQPAHAWHSPSYLDHAGDGVADRRTYRRGNFIVGTVWGLSSLALVKVIIWGSVEIAKSSDPKGLLQALEESDHSPFPWLTFMAALIGFVPLAVILPWMIQRMHRRTWRVSATPFATFSWRQIGIGSAVGGGIYLFVAAVTGLSVRGNIEFSFDVRALLPAVIVLVVFIPMQAFGQELFFRGYGLQQASLDIRSTRGLALVSGLGFGVPFLTAPFIIQWLVPEVQVPDIPWSERFLLMAGYVVMGAALAVVSIRTGTIEFAIGAAGAINLFAALVLSPRAGSIAGGSVWEVEPGIVATLVYVGALVAGMYAMARIGSRFIPDPATRTLLDHWGEPVPGAKTPLPTGNPMWRVSFRGLVAHRLRLVLTILSIALGVSFIVATLVFSDTTKGALDRFYSGEPAPIVVQPVDEVTLAGQDGSGPLALTMPESVRETIRGVPGVEYVAAQVQQEGVLILAPDGETVGSASSAHIGASWDEDQIKVAPGGSGGGFDGELPVGVGQVAVDTTTAERTGLQVGDTVRLVTPLRTDKDREWQITGIIDIGLYGGASVALFDLPTAQEFITGEGLVNQILVSNTEDTDVGGVVAAINDALGKDSGVRAITGRQAAQQAQSQVGEGLSFLNTVLLIFGFIAVFMSTFLIFNTFSMLVAQRTRELALVRAVGAGRDQVQWSVLIQALVVGVIGTLLGGGLGMGLSVGLRWILIEFGTDIPTGGLVIQPTVLLIALLTGVGVTVLAAWIPALRASQIPPVQAMQGGRPSRGFQQRIALGAVFGSLALITMAVSLRDTTPGTAVAWMGLSALLAIGAFIALSPLMAGVFVRLLGQPLRSPIGRLARSNARRNRRRTAATAAALTVGVALMSIVSILAVSTIATAEDQIDRAIGADITLGAPPLYRPFDHSITREISQVPGVGSVTYVRSTTGQRAERAIPVFGTEPDKITQAINLDVVAGDLADVVGDSIALDADVAEQYRLDVGDEFRATFRTGEDAFTVAAIYEPIIVYQGILTDFATAKRLGADGSKDSAAYVTLAPGADPAQVRAAVSEVIQRNPALQVQDKETLKDDFRGQIDRLLGFIYVMLALTVIIAVLGIANTLLLSVYERTSELGMLRAVGATQKQLRRLISAEAVLVGLFGAISGVLLGLAYGLLLQRVMVPLGIEVLQIPWFLLIIFVVAGAVAGVAASIWPAVRASKLNILRAINAE